MKRETKQAIKPIFTRRLNRLLDASSNIDLLEGFMVTLDCSNVSVESYPEICEDTMDPAKTKRVE